MCRAALQVRRLRSPHGERANKRQLGGTGAMRDRRRGENPGLRFERARGAQSSIRATKAQCVAPHCRCEDFVARMENVPTSASLAARAQCGIGVAERTPDYALSAHEARKAPSRLRK